MSSGFPIERKYGRRALQSLEDILDFASDAAALVARGRGSYDADRMLQLAGEAIASRIGEATSRLPDAVIDAHPEIPFRLAKGMRNIVAHDYDRVDTDVVWTALESDIPRFGPCMNWSARGGGSGGNRGAPAYDARPRVRSSRSSTWFCTTMPHR